MVLDFRFGLEFRVLLTAVHEAAVHEAAVHDLHHECATDKTTLVCGQRWLHISLSCHVNDTIMRQMAEGRLISQESDNYSTLLC